MTTMFIMKGVQGTTETTLFEKIGSMFNTKTVFFKIELEPKTFWLLTQHLNHWSTSRLVGMVVEFTFTECSIGAFCKAH